MVLGIKPEKKKIGGVIEIMPRKLFSVGKKTIVAEFKDTTYTLSLENEIANQWQGQDIANLFAVGLMALSYTNQVEDALKRGGYPGKIEIMKNCRTNQTEKSL